MAQRCDFCGSKIPVGTGMKYVLISGKALDFCSSKCEKNMIKLGRKPRNIRWTMESREARGKK